jgi:hypothetical protein
VSYAQACGMRGQVTENVMLWSAMFFKVIFTLISGERTSKRMVDGCSGVMRLAVLGLRPSLWA